MKIVVVVESGVVQEVLSNEESEVVVLDLDVEGAEEVKKIQGNEVYVYKGLRNTHVDPERVEKIYQEINE